MTETTTQRRWTAAVKIDGYQPVESALSESDLQADQIKVAVALAKELLAETGRTEPRSTSSRRRRPGRA